MKKYLDRCFAIAIIILFCLPGRAQENCSLLPPVINIDFGNSTDNPNWKLTSIKNYRQIEDYCPDDGYMTVTPRTQDCFSGHWHTLREDHTAGDVEGRMLIVNASYTPGTCYMINVAGLKPGARYEVSSWIMNICRPDEMCVDIPPRLEFRLISGGKVIKRMVTGSITVTYEPQWRRYAGFFEMPADQSGVTLQLINNNKGGCGNDFALDDIVFRECVVPEKIKRILPTPQPQRSAVPQPEPVKVERKTEEVPVVTRSQEPGLSPVSSRSSTPQNQVVTLPQAISRRANPVVKRILTTAGEMTIQLYDNGQIDGDTISIFHNNQLVLSKAGLSARPLTLKININESSPHHELVMVAENLGSIPPNTSLMVATVNGKRYEVFISSSEEKNAKVVIDLKE